MNSRRRLRAGAVALVAAVTALVVPTAVAAPDASRPVVLEPLEGTLRQSFVVSYPFTTGAGTQDLAETALLPPTGELRVFLNAGVRTTVEDLRADVVDRAALDAFEEGTAPRPPDPLVADLPVTLSDRRPTFAAEDLEVTVPRGDAALAGVDDVYVAFDPLRVVALGTAQPLRVPVDLTRDDVEAVLRPSSVVTSLTLGGSVEEPPRLPAGEPFAIALPDDGGLLRAAGIEEIDDRMFLQLGWPPSPLPDGSGARAGAEAEPDAVPAGDVLQGPRRGVPLVESSGTSARVTVSEDQPPGRYHLSARWVGGGVTVELGTQVDVLPTAAPPTAPPTAPPDDGPPTTAAPPVTPPTAPVTPRPTPRLNPGLRSNTGVEAGGPTGAVDGRLVGAGVLVLLMTSAVVVVVRRRTPA